MRLTTTLLKILPLSVLLLSACSAGMTTDYTAQTRNGIETVSAWSTLEGAEPATYLNDLIHLDALDELVNEALTANPGLNQTLLTLKIRQAEYRKARGGQLPSATAGYGASKEEGSDSVYTGSLTVSWEADLWGRLANEKTAAAKDVAQQQALYQSAKDILAAEVMQAFLQIIAQGHAIEIETRRVATLSRNEQFILQRYRNGLGNLEDLDGARSSTLSAKADLAEYEEELERQKRSLNALLGRTNTTKIDVAKTYPEVLVALADLPQQTLSRRPDLKAAYLAIEAQQVRTKAAYKNLLPSISLEAALTDVADSPTKALFTDPLWSLLGQLTAPLFQGGQLKAAAQIAELETAQAYQAYRETLLTAVTEVEDALGKERSLARQQAHMEAALKSAQNNLTQYKRSYRSGLADILDLLNVQQQTYDLEEQLDNLIYERLANRIDLGLALGLGVRK